MNRPVCRERTLLRRKSSPRTSFALVIAAQVVLFAGANLPTPLFPIYANRYGFGPGVVTLLFASYVGVLIPALVLLGPLADRVGRRPLLVIGITLTAVSSAAFVLAAGVVWLFAGEVIYGMGSALVMSCVSVTIRELHPKQDVAAAAVAASVAMAAGLTLGPLVSGVLAAITPWPTVSPYLLDIVVALALAVGLTRIPETRPARSPSAPKTPVIHVPAEIRREFIGPASAGAASFMMVSWVFALSPSFLHEALGIQLTRPLVAGIFAALVVFTSGVSQLVFRRHLSQPATTLGLSLVAAGMAIMTFSAVLSSLAVAVIGAVVAGAGAGITQMNAMAAVQQIAPVRTRSSVVSAYVLLCYVALSVPVIVAGEAAEPFGLVTVTRWFAVALAAAIGVALLLSRPRPAQRPSEDLTSDAEDAIEILAA